MYSYCIKIGLLCTVIFVAFISLNIKSGEITVCVYYTQYTRKNKELTKYFVKRWNLQNISSFLQNVCMMYE